ncbi:hypothetical protein [Nonomuraea dietziae]|nr:hypothetical protein [Nonomuraea dietziae]
MADIARVESRPDELHSVIRQAADRLDTKVSSAAISELYSRIS